MEGKNPNRKATLIFTTLLLATGTQFCLPVGETKKNDTSSAKWALASIGAGAATLFWKSCDSAKNLYDQARMLDFEWHVLRNRWFEVEKYCQDNKINAVLASTMDEAAKQHEMKKTITNKMSNFIGAHTGTVLQEEFKSIDHFNETSFSAVIAKAESQFDFIKTVGNKSLMAKLYTPVLIAGTLVTAFAAGKTMHSHWKNYQQKKQAKNNITSWSKEVCSISLCNN